MATEAEIKRFEGAGTVLGHWPVWKKIPHATIQKYSPNITRGGGQLFPSEVKAVSPNDSRNNTGKWVAELLLTGEWVSRGTNRILMGVWFDYDPGMDCLYKFDIPVNNDWKIQSFRIYLGENDNGNTWYDELVWEKISAPVSANDLALGGTSTSRYTW